MSLPPKPRIEPEADIHSLLEVRWSPRAFTDEEISPQTLRPLFEAARWSASCFNAQPWNFIETRRGAEAFDRLLDCLTPNNQSWAKNAALLVLAIARLNFENGKPNRHAYYDLGQSVAQLTLEATAAGLGVHQMAGFDAARARERFQSPEGYDPVSTIAIGFPGQPERLPDKLQERELAPRERSPQRAFLFAEQWGVASPLTEDPRPKS